MGKEIGILHILSTLILLSTCDTGTFPEEETKRSNEEIDRLEETISASQLKIEDIEETVAQNNDIIKRYSDEFSYLSGLTKFELQAYNAFLEAYDTTYLKDYSPENSLLLYYHPVVISDWEAIYELAYNGSSLPSINEFNELYYRDPYHQAAIESALDYWYYDRLEVREKIRMKRQCPSKSV